MPNAKYDHQEAINKATRLFWAKGFHATSMRNIQQAIDMRPGSIYATFGSKEALFSKAIQHYTSTSKDRLNAYVESSTSPLTGLKKFIEDSIAGGQTSAPSTMCMLVKTIAELTDDNADLLAEAKRLLQDLESAFADVLARAQKMGEVDAARSPEYLARYLQMQIMGLRTYAHMQGSKEQVMELIDGVFHSLTGQEHLSP
ncbi:TetR/AcrR family transcriptional regulator [Microbulbifer thermotolerans]|uniref:TetR/AcrR family transcriptional regulator n=1 Tax=Microbulbifer thermotolerans TaxID=252514 RepID=A0AB35HWF5_MICTH|nr:TetR/AcrR family transcriptional regulator [Microbulbifer thermotolerans]MCX2778533.1 TetR/AcrR family transcriptional regulator [Microbulbifer thermotolerans]MCX2782912.1 TetR/AcrR family transcriptional regulator [Microbulbifer thermotolerans]MCX2794017.1 TetR/AcrR family transcriptional regulator [Microbulbifer thermotolerans]MCX2801721.1 TetR/AcrR family transcriptional regulator [Microbulbifer thermotolerans]MCX2803958.1 TetR/AcrR family transcriptional regulator [Microbulbifer thermot